MNPSETLFVLVHDAWQSGWAWQAVADYLTERGWQATTLNLPGHAPGETISPETTLQSYATALVEFAQTQQTATGAKNLVLGGHGLAGPLLQLAAEQLGPAVSALVFAGAYVLRDGESISDTMLPEMAEFFQGLATLRPDNCIDLASVPDFWRFSVVNDDPHLAEELLPRLIPEPVGLFFEKVSLPTFFQQRPPCAYLSFNEDMSLPPGPTEFYPRQANKLGPHRHLTVNASHQGIMTKPREVAEALIFLASQDFK